MEGGTHVTMTGVRLFFLFVFLSESIRVKEYELSLRMQIVPKKRIQVNGCQLATDTCLPELATSTSRTHHDALNDIADHLAFIF